MTNHAQAARRMWHQLEPVHALFYYAPEIFDEAAALGYDVSTRWPTYFPFRSAPLNEPGPARVASAFYSFSPAMVAEHMASAWTVASAGEVLAARLRGLDGLFRRLLGDLIGGADLTEAAELVRRAAEAAEVAGRPMAAATAELPWPDEPHLALWQGITLLREHRGDGHLAALLTAELDPCEALVSFAAIGAAPKEIFASRQWGEDDWTAAVERLRSRGLTGADGSATEAGIELRDQIERHTDLAAAGPWKALGDKGMDRLVELNVPILTAALLSGLLPSENTLGIARVPGPQW